MAKPLALADLELQLDLLPPISRGAHLAGPGLHAQRLVKIWKADDGDDVPLAQAWRLLDEGAVRGAIFRSLEAVEDYPGDPKRHWIFPRFEHLLPELQNLSWQRMLDGVFFTEGIKGVRAKRHRVVLLAELPRLTPDWELSRLCRGGSDEFIDVRVCRAPAEPVKKAWRGRLDKAALKAAMEEIARTSPPDARPSETVIWNALKDRLGPNVTRQQARHAIADHAPHLRGRRGYRSKGGKSPS